MEVSVGSDRFFTFLFGKEWNVVDGLARFDNDRADLIVLRFKTEDSCFVELMVEMSTTR